MFNKIFMHEMKTPLAKGAFYLKNAPSKQNQANFARLFSQINEQLENFRMLEEIVSKSQIDDKFKNFNLFEKNDKKDMTNLAEMDFGEIFEAVKSKLNLKPDDKIIIDLSPNFKIYGERELWGICLKNLIENALNYSPNHEIKIYAHDYDIVFENRGEPLPVNITTYNNELRLNWKLDKTLRHKSSSGYGFGLFIIQKTALLNGYEIGYHHIDGRNVIKFYTPKPW